MRRLAGVKKHRLEVSLRKIWTVIVLFGGWNTELTKPRRKLPPGTVL